MWDSLGTARDLGRAYELASILIRYGGGDMVRRMGLHSALTRLGKVLPLTHLEELVALPPPQRVRRALEEMGPTFIKLGQVLATRVDLFAPDWIEQFGQLHSHAPGVPWEQIHAQLTEDLGASPESVFAGIDPVPLAAASIAQVHRAELHDGRKVVVKVRRPGIRPRIEADLRLLQRAARSIEAHFPELAQFQPVGVVQQFKASLTLELDLAAECRHAERIAANLSDRADIVVPAVHWDYTSERVNVQDFVDGIPICDLAALRSAGIDGPRLARQGAQAVLQMMLRDGFFHADPHPGNVFALPDHRIALIDYGMVGRLTPARRAQVVSLLHGLVMRDAEHVADVLLDWTGNAEVDEERVTRDVDAFIDRFHSVPLAQLDLAAMLLGVTELLRTHRLALPADLALMIKVCITLEGMGRSLDGNFDMARQAAPFLRRAMRERYAPRTLVRAGSRALMSGVDLLTDLPRDARRLLRAARAGKVKLHIDVEHLQRFGDQVDHSANRLTMGVVIAALVVGSSITMTVEGGPTLLGLPVFGFMGFVGAVVAGAWLVISIWRSGGGK